MGELANTFSWSYSRHGMFSECLRKYWLSYYGSWGGWGRGASERARELYLLKNLTSTPMWLGTVVHDVAEEALKALAQGERPWVERAVELGLERARRDIASSQAGRYRENPKKQPGFQEHYYAEPEPDWDAELAEIERQIQNLFGHPVFRRMMDVPERILEVEILRSVPIEGVPVWVKLDALMQGNDGGVVIVDWKTGRDHDDASIAQQLGVYGIYAVQLRGVPVEKVQALHVNLRHNTHTAHPINAEFVAQSRDFVARSAEAMRAGLSDRERNVAPEDGYPMLPEGDERCARCRFRRDCGRG